jgi:hypothetical protein
MDVMDITEIYRQLIVLALGFRRQAFMKTV